MALSNDDIETYVNNLELQIKGIKDEIFRLAWYMRGGVSSEDLFHRYSYEDRNLLNELIKDNIEATKKSGLALI